MYEGLSGGVLNGVRETTDSRAAISLMITVVFLVWGDEPKLAQNLFNFGGKRRHRRVLARHNVYIWVRDGKTTAIWRTDLRFSRHNGSPIECSPETPQIPQHYRIQRFKDAFNFPPLCRETPASRPAEVSFSVHFEVDTFCTLTSSGHKQQVNFFS